MNIYLIGMMGSGKSTVGKTLSEKMHKPFIDLDSEIEKGTGKNISEIFDKFATENKIILTTEKDAMRLKSIEKLKSLPIYFMSIKIEFIKQKFFF